MRAFSAFPFLARGLKLFLERPRLRLWVLIPVLVGLVALVPWCWFAPDLLRALRGALPDFLAPETSFAAEPGAWNAFVAALQGAGYAVLRWGAHLLALLLVLLSGLLLLLFAVKVVGAAANDRLSEEVERHVLAKTDGIPPCPPLVQGTLHALRVTLVQLAVVFAVFVPLFLLSHLLPGVGALVFSALLFLFGSVSLCYDAMSYSMDRRLMPLSRRAKLMLSHPWKCFVFGAQASVLLMVPVVNLFLFPLFVAGGTLLLLDISGEAAEPGNVAPRSPTGSLRDEAGQETV